MPLNFKQILRIARRNGARSVRLFGSYAKGNAAESSDIDLLVDLEPDRSLLDLIAIKQDLEELFHKKVDVVTENSLSPYLREQILREAVPL